MSSLVVILNRTQYRRRGLGSLKGSKGVITIREGGIANS